MLSPDFRGVHGEWVSDVYSAFPYFNAVELCLDEIAQPFRNLPSIRHSVKNVKVKLNRYNVHGFCHCLRTHYLLLVLLKSNFTGDNMRSKLWVQ